MMGMWFCMSTLACLSTALIITLNNVSKIGKTVGLFGDLTISPSPSRCLGRRHEGRTRAALFGTGYGTRSPGAWLT